MVETIRSLGHPRLLLYVLCVTIVGNPAGMRVGRERQRQFVSGHARAAVETAVDVPDHEDALSPDRKETIMTIQFKPVFFNVVEVSACFWTVPGQSGAKLPIFIFP